MAIDQETRMKKAREFYTNKKVLVTGGAGFLGSHLAEFLVEDGAKVRVIDNLERGNLENLAAVKKDIEFIQGDLRDPETAKRVTRGMEVVINMAAKVTGIHYNTHHHGDMFTQNALIGMNALEASRENGVRRFTVLSTACIYPHDAKVPTPESEGHRGEPEPTNEGYGWGKRMCEKQGIYYAKEYGMEVAICRPFNAYGNRDYFDEATSHVIPALIKKILDGDNPVRIWGSGNQSRVFVHGKDFARGIELVTAFHPKADPVNIGHDRQITIRDLFYKLCELLGRHPEPFFDTSMPEGYPRRAADTTKLKAVTLGWEPVVTLEQGLKEMIEWYLARTSAAKNP
jgi:nucleoside-diphosphate-sugar epimerase